MDGSIESSIVVLSLTTFAVGLVMGIFLSKFIDMWKPSAKKKSK